MSLRTSTVYRHFFKAALADVRAYKAKYKADVKDWYENGDGRSTKDGGRGYAYPECIHGSSLWTDYDNICGGCEDSLTDLQEASIAARQAFVRFNDMFEWVTQAPAGLPSDIRTTLFDLTTDLFPKKG